MIEGATLPYSSTSGKSFSDRAVVRMVHQLFDTVFDHHKVLDLGIGAGTYSDRYSNTLLKRGKFYWTGVEIWNPYVDKFNLRAKYDFIALTDAITYLSQCQDLHDICFMGDIIEHMTKEQAIQMMDLALERCNVVVMSIPIILYPQDEYEGNPYEKHVKDDWSHKEVMETFPHIVEYGVENEIGVYVLSKKKFNLVAGVLKPQIAVYGICKDEMKFIDRFYHSVEDADFISIVDTGSTDGTFERLMELVVLHTEQHGHEEEIRIEKFQDGSPRNCSDGMMQIHKALIDPWRFDDARNIALSLLPEDPDVCISIDIDEMLEPGWKEILCEAVLNDLHTQGRPADRYHHRFSTIWNWDSPEQKPNFTDHWHERIHSRMGYRWKLPVHEVLVKSGEEQIHWVKELKMIQKPDTSKSRSSYLKLLEQAIEEDSGRWKLWSFYANDLSSIGRYQEAIIALTTARNLEDSDKAYLSFQLSLAYKSLKKFDKAVAELWTAINDSPNREYKVWLARLYRDINKPREALNLVLMASEITDRTFGYVYDPTCWGFEFDQLVQQLTEECKL